MNTLLHEDAAARSRALEPDSFIVEAPAGAGKTELLTQRALRLLALVDHPEEVVALTFTNKAAAEMRDRLLGGLQLAAAGIRPEGNVPHRQVTYDLGRAVLARDAERNWQLLAHPGRLAVTTLDALCAGLARQMPLLSRFGAQPAVADDPEKYYQDATRRTLALIEGDPPASDIVAAALDRVDNDAGRLQDLLVGMLSRREQWLAHTIGSDTDQRIEAEAGLAALVRRDLAAALNHCPGRWQAGVMPAARFAATEAPEPARTALAPLLDWNTPLSGDPADLPRWQSLAALLLTGEGRLRRSFDKRNGLPPTPEGQAYKTVLNDALKELSPSAEKTLQNLRALSDPRYDEATWAAVETYSRLFNLACAQLWLVFQEAGAVDFSEIAQRALRALGEDEAPTDLALALDYRIRHLLVDEFQDTSPLQVQLIAALTRGWNSGDGRTLFLVGDPMQSIYRFRKADVGLFLRVREEGIGNLRPEKLRLYRNNRSRPALVDWVNREFPAIFPAGDDPLAGAVSYAESTATRPDDPAAGVFVHPSLAGEGASAESRQMLAVIRQARQADPQGSIAVLVRARSHLAALIALLRRDAPDLPFQAVECEALAGRQAIQDLLALARALFHRADRVHWLAILRAPWCGLRLSDLHALAADKPQDTLWSLLQDSSRIARLSDDGQRRLRPLIAVLGNALAEAGRQHPRRWIEGVWRQLGGPHCLEGPTALAESETFFACIDTLLASGHFDGETLTTAVTSLFAPSDPSPVAASLQLMTIHKSKGLEFDTVLLPGLHRRTGSDDSPLLIWDSIALGRDGQEYLVAAPLPRREETALTSGIYQALRRQERDRGHHENARLLYVAATRARQALHLFGAVTLRDGQAATPSGDSLLALLWPGAVGAALTAGLQQRLPEPPSAPDPVAPALFVPALRRLPESALPDNFPIPNQRALAATRPASLRLAIDADIGTLVHRHLELIARQGLAQWPVENIDRQQAICQHWLRTRGHFAADADAGAQRAVAALRSALTSEAGRWILSRQDQAASELCLCAQDGSTTQMHAVDRTFINDGYRWIVDYKCVRLPTAATPADFLRQAEEYRPQLERYASLFVREGLPCRLAIFFVEQGRLCELAAVA